VHESSPEPNVPTAAVGRRDGYDAVRLVAGPAAVEVVPALAMVGSSFTVAGVEVLALHGGLDGYAAGRWTGAPLLHPWANRLSCDVVEQRGIDTSTDPDPSGRVRRDADGLPIHGVHTADAGWATTRVGPGAVVAGELDSGECAELAAVFPFPHRVGVRWELAAPAAPGGWVEATVTTTVQATGSAPTPVSFGWHPYFALPGVPRADWTLHLPDRDDVELDARRLPTGRRTGRPAESFALAARTLDDAHAVVPGATFGLSGGGVAVEVRFDRGYRHAQVYAPGEPAVVALEPMTAPIDALTTGRHPWVAPGERYEAVFTIRVRVGDAGFS
jgi:galactose mutarotase-like enzyme